MRLVCLAAVLVALVGARGASPPPAVVNVVAVHATQENRPQRHVDAALAGLDASIADITEFDTFRELHNETVSVPFAETQRVVLTSKYALFITQLGTGKGAQVRLSLVIKQPPKAGQDKPIETVATTVLMSPGTPFRMRGLPWQGGELVVVVSLKG